MGKHSKNAGVMGSESLTYHERKALGFGTVTERLGKDPVCTPDGFLFSREAILENLLAQKKANKRKLAAWKAEQEERAKKASERAEIDAGAALLAFDRENHAGASAETSARLRERVASEAEALLDGRPHAASSAVTIASNAERAAQVRSFWLPSRAAGADAGAASAPPEQGTRCPASGKPLRLKDLTPVHFAAGDAPDELIDPLSRDVLTNASRLVVVRPTGDVVTEHTWRTCVLPEGRYQGHRVGPEDAIELQRGGTGFALHDKEAQAKKHFLLGPGSGLADRRGQHGGPSSKFGLRFGN